MSKNSNNDFIIFVLIFVQLAALVLMAWQAHKTDNEIDALIRITQRMEADYAEKLEALDNKYHARMLELRQKNSVPARSKHSADRRN